MPSLSESQIELPENWVSVPPKTPAVPPPTGGVSLEPGFPVYMRCPVPPTSFNVDSARQFYRGSSVPQFRTFSAPTLATTAPSGGGTTSTTVLSSSSSVSTTISLSIKTVAVTTPVLNPGNAYAAIASMSKAFTLTNIAVSAPARVRVYATATAQTLDIARPSTQALNFATTQGVFADVTIDSTPYSWNMAPEPSCANGDFPQTANAYVTVDNASISSQSYIVTLQYVALTS